MYLNKMLWILNGNKHRGEEKGVFVQVWSVWLFPPAENQIWKLHAFIQACKLENTLWSRIAMPSVWNKSKYIVLSICVHPCIFFPFLQDWLVWAWRRIWSASSVLQMLLLVQPSISAEYASTGSVFLAIPHAYSLNRFLGMWNSKN